METPTPSQAAHIQALRNAYAALNRNDIPGFTAILDPQIERIEPAEAPQSATYHGLAAVTAHFTKARATWAEGSCQPERFIAHGDRIIAFVHVRVRLKHETHWRDARVADVYTFRDAKAIQFRTFIDEREALEWAGIKAPDAPTR